MKVTTRYEMKIWILTAILVGMLIFDPTVASASTVNFLQDDFDDETAALNYSSFENWTVLTGAIDTIASGTFGIDCAGGTGICIDLDGSSGDAGELVTNDTFAAGVYTLSFALSGNQRVPSADDEVTVLFGDLSESISISDPFAPFEIFTRTVTVGVGGDVLTFSHAGGDNVGLILDNVTVAPVPLPGAFYLFATACIGLFAGRLRQA
ncbi:MAG: PEP-CTERM sorting domain-containing protein [Gammaproteobacteria bacterium]